MKHRDFVKTLVSDTKPVDHPVKLKFLQYVREHKQLPPTCYGAFGEWKGCDGYVEEYIKPPEGGAFIKLYGCSYLMKGIHEKYRLYGLGQAKALLSEVPRDIIGKSWLLSSAFLLMFLFQRKKFIYTLDQIMWSITVRTVNWCDLPENQYNAPVKEIKRAAYAALAKEFGIDPANVTDPYRAGKKQLGCLLFRFIRFTCLFLEMDTAYLLRVQDAIRQSLFETLEVLISRETGLGIAHKWKFIKPMIKLGFFFMPKLKQVSDTFFAELDVDKVKMDDADWYFCLRYKSYNFGGLSEEERFALRDKIDLDKGHVFLL